MNAGTTNHPHVDEPKAEAGARHDIYANIHKALRRCMAHALDSVGRLDAQDHVECLSVASQVRSMLMFARTHLDKEETYLHAALEERCPGSTAQASAEHAGHQRAFEDLDASIEALLLGRADDRDRYALALYRKLALFVGENFLHMQLEETEHNAALWRAFSDPEIAAIEGRIVGSMPPEMLREVMRWMAPAVDPASRSALLAKVRGALPSPAFDGVLALVRPQLSLREQAKLDVALAA